MRAVIQRVSEARVSVDGRIKGEIGRGLLVLVAVEDADGAADGEWLSGKLSRLRIFPDAQNEMNLSVQEAGGDLLVISQFTLFGSTQKGNRPSYTRSAAPAVAIPLYEGFLIQLARAMGKPVQAGVFGTDMQVSLCNDGPVTLIIDSKLRE